MASLSRQLAQWVVGLRHQDLPAEVVDRAKGVTLHSLASVLLGSQSPGGRQAVKLITEEEAGVRDGTTIMVDGARVTKGGAAFANAEMAMAGGKWDTFRMLTHPGTSIIPGAFVAAETAGASGRDFITGIAAGYEVMERLAADFIPTVMARGFHAGVVFGIFGPAVAAAKMMRFTEDQVNSTIALCASLAAGNLEGPRSGGRALREGGAVRNAMLAVALARQGHVGGETVLEGDAGFYHAYAGNNQGRLTYSFVGDTQTSLSEPAGRRGAAAREHAVLHGVRRREARLPGAAEPGRPVWRRRPARGARSDEAGDPHPVARDDALRPADHDSHQGRPELHE